MSLFKQFITLRDKFSDQYAANVDFLDRLITPVSGASDFLPISGKRCLQITDATMSLIDSTSGDVLNTLTDIQSAQLLQTVADTNTKETWSELIQQGADGTNSYQLCSDLISKYSYSTRVSYSDICNYLNNYQFSDTQTIRESLFSSVDDEGFISRHSFIAVLKEWIKTSKNQADTGNGWDLDTSNPYALQSLMGCVIQALSAILSVICDVLAWSFGALFALIGAIFSALSTLVGAAYERAKLVYDPLIGNNYVAGPILALDTRNTMSLHINGGYRDHVYLLESNGIATFAWQDKDSNNNNYWQVNAYYYPFWKPLQCVNYFTQQGQFIWSDPNHNGSFCLPNPKWLSNSVYRNIRYDTLHYGDDDTPTNANEIVLSLGLGFLMQTLAADFKRLGADPFLTYEYYIHVGYPGQTPSWWAATDEKLTAWIIQGLNQLYIMSSNNNVNWEDTTLTTCCNNIADYLAEYISSYVMNDRMNALCRATDCSELTVIDTSYADTSFPMLYSPIAGLYAGIYVWNNMLYMNIDGYTDNLKWFCDPFDQVDILPTSWGITLPQFNASKVNSILLAVGICVTVACIGGLKLKKKMAKRKMSKQALRANAVNEARTAMLNDPTNLEKRKDFEDLAWKYDHYGKWFGWGSYDAANGWTNTGETSASNLASLFSGVSYTSATDLSTIQNLLIQVKNLIN